MIPTAVHPIVQIGHMDCGVAVLAMYLGETYPKVAMVALGVDRLVQKTGLSVRGLRRAARVLERGPLKRQNDWSDVDLYEATAILYLKNKQRDYHYALLFEGVVIDPANGLVWDLDAWLETKKWEIRSLLYEDSLTR